jgi:phosphoadenosine phosphosulfate reductase
VRLPFGFGQGEGGEGESEVKDFWGKSKVDYAIELLRKHEPPEGYYLAFSGGKDSQCIYRLAEMAGVKFDAHYNRAMEPPELVRFIKEHYPKVQRHLPTKTMWQLIRENGIPPLRTIRYCCSMLKERGGMNRFKVLGIRKEESTIRKKRKLVEKNKNSTKGMIICPILDWSIEEVWGFIKIEKIPYCSLYDDGFDRLGCVMCPCAGPVKMKRDYMRWPKIGESYRRACIRAYSPETSLGWKDGNEMFEWWLTGKAHKETPWFN